MSEFGAWGNYLDTFGIVNLSYSERVWADWTGIRNRQAAVTVRQTSKDRDLKSR
jgi:hypothetical protein